MDKNSTQILLADTVFSIDYQQSAFVENQNPLNKIYFSDLLPAAGTPFLTMNYNPAIKNQYLGLNGDLLKASQKISIPKALLKGPLDDLSMLNQINQVAYDRKQGFQLLNKETQDRLGEPPVFSDVYLEGYRFTLQLRTEAHQDGVLQSAADPKKDISLKEANWERGASGYQFPFDRISGTKANIDLNRITEIPPNVVFLRIGDDLELDSVGVAQKVMDGKGTELLLKFPYKAKHAAVKIPWPPRVQEKIKENRKRMVLPELENKRPVKLKLRG